MDKEVRDEALRAIWNKHPDSFVLYRKEDPTGVSGTGVVAEGVMFSDGTVVIRWIVGEHQSTVVWPNIKAVEKIHGHDGRTVIYWLRTEPS